MTTKGHNSGNKLTVRLHPADNVVTAKIEMLAGTDVKNEGLSVSQSIPSGHKIATKFIPKGDSIRKYDQIIGFATTDISIGQHVHVHNVEMQDFARDYKFCEGVTPTNYFPAEER